MLPPWSGPTCCVSTCPHSRFGQLAAGQRPAATYFPFPTEDPKRLFLWMKAVLRPESAQICSAHFLQEHFVPPRLFDEEAKLNRTASPTLRLTGFEEPDPRAGRAQVEKNPLPPLNCAEREVAVPLTLEPRKSLEIPFLEAETLQPTADVLPDVSSTPPMTVRNERKEMEILKQNLSCKTSCMQKTSPAAVLAIIGEVKRVNQQEQTGNISYQNIFCSDGLSNVYCVSVPCLKESMEYGFQSQPSAALTCKTNEVPATASAEVILSQEVPGGVTNPSSTFTKKVRKRRVTSEVVKGNSSHKRKPVSKGKTAPSAMTTLSEEEFNRAADQQPGELKSDPHPPLSDSNPLLSPSTGDKNSVCDDLSKHGNSDHKQGLKDRICNTCGKLFTTKGGLRLHEKLHTKEKACICETCGKRFTQMSCLKRHRKTHTGDKQVTCETCGKEFITRSPLNRHKVGHTGEKHFKCNICDHKQDLKDRTCNTCGKSFTTKGSLRMHEKSHTNEKACMCETCGKTYTQISYLKRHRQTHTGDKQVTCETCGKAFITRSALNRHKAVHTGEKNFKCNICDKAYRFHNSLVSHRRKHVGGKPYQCNICGKIFHLYSSYYAHKQRHIADYECKACGKHFKTKVQLTNHIHNHTGGRSNKCIVCSEQFKTKEALKYHMFIHTGKEPYKCAMCDKIFSQKGSLKAHRILHTGEKPHMCNSCGKRFAFKGSLKIHLLTHTSEKPHKCAECGKSFIFKHSLMEHQLTHTGEKPQECTECGRKFRTYNQVKVHMRTHTGEKPYECDVCGRKFSLNANMMAHKKAVHEAEKSFACDTCGKQFSLHSRLVKHYKVHT